MYFCRFLFQYLVKNFFFHAHQVGRFVHGLYAFTSHKRNCLFSWEKYISTYPDTRIPRSCIVKLSSGKWFCRESLAPTLKCCIQKYLEIWSKSLLLDSLARFVLYLCGFIRFNRILKLLLYLCQTLHPSPIFLTLWRFETCGIYNTVNTYIFS